MTNRNAILKEATRKASRVMRVIREAFCITLIFIIAVGGLFILDAIYYGVSK